MANDSEIWSRLRRGATLEDLELPRKDGRIQLVGVETPSDPVLRGLHWRSVDFSRSRLSGLRFFDCKLENCSFEGAICRDWRLWTTTVSDCSFQSCDLRTSALGGVNDGKRNAFSRVDFARADMRKTVYVSCDMLECTFADAKLEKVDFAGTVFTNCVFKGAMADVIFQRRAFKGESFPANEMKGVDFRAAKFRHVEFRSLDMTDVLWPEDNEHIVIQDYKATLDRALAVLSPKSDVKSKMLTAILTMRRKWAGENQRVGVLSIPDLVEAGGPEAATEVLQILQRQ
jgi:uncharacterized protein YjbI with pentapeptide repeats